MAVVRRAFLLAVSTLLLARAMAAAQPASMHVARYTVDDGLAQNNVSAIVQDSIGYIWVGTSRGLQRFDGYGFTPLSPLSAGAAPQLRGPIGDLLIDARGRLWIAADTILFWGFAGRDTMQSMRGSSAVAPDSSGHLWFVRQRDQLGRVDWNAAAPRVTVFPIDSLPSCCTRIATTRDQQTIWVVPAAFHPGDVIRIDVASGAWQRYRLPGITLVGALLEDARGRIWAAGLGGIAVLDRNATEFRSLPAFRGMEVGDVQRHGSDLLIATERFLARVDVDGRELQRWTPAAAYGAGPLLTSALFVDREAGFWLGTLAAGLVRLDPTPPVFGHVLLASNTRATSDFIMALHETSSGELYVGTLGSGAFVLSTTQLNPEPWPMLPEQTRVTSGNVWDFAEDDTRQVWIATTSSLCPARGACIPATAVAAFADLTRARDGWLWFALAEGGIGSFHPATRRLGARVNSGWTIVVFADSVNDILWLGGEQLQRARMANGQLLEPLQRVPADVAPGEPIYDIRRDRHGTVWVASHRGLQRWDAAQQRFAPVDVAELRGTTVFSLAEDGEGRLWLGTSHGLVQYSTVNGVARRYRRQDGVLSGEFNRRAALRLRDGTMVFGGLHGLTVFRPERVVASRAVAPLVFTRWQKATRNGAVEGHVVGDAAHDDAELELRPGDRAFTIEFAALTFAAGPTRRYRYRLEGLSSEWTETSDRAVTYGTPRAGRYVFEVQTSAGFEGAWSAAATLPVRVIPPVYATTWFRVLLAVTILAALWLLHRLRLQQALATERLRLRISRDLHDEIGAGLSSIALLSDAVGMVGTGERKQLERIGHSARGMVADLRDIVWAIDPDGDRLKDVVSRMKDVATDLLPDTRVTFHAPAGDGLSDKIGMATRRDLIRIYKEVLHNIARHARATAVDIQLHTHGDDVQLIISDDGVGFDPNMVRNGVGLRSMRERAARLGGNLELTRPAAGGTVVRLTVKRT